MKKLLGLLFILVSTINICIGSKEVKITVTPSDAKIFIDGNYVADGVTTATIRKKEGFLVVKFVKEGYVTLETKIFYTDNRTAVSFTMRRDAFQDISVASGLVNKYFTVKVDSSLYKMENGKRNSELAWKMIHQIILNYFEEIQITDMASGFIQTPWLYKSFPDAERQVRTRVSVKESNLGGALTFQIKVSSEVAPIFAAQKDESFQEINRILKELEPLISEFQARLGKM